VINFSRSEVWQKFLSEDLISSAAARAEQLGYHMEEFWLRDAEITAQQLIIRPQLHRVTTNRFQGMRLAIKRLREHGYSRPGLALRRDQDARVDHQWGAAFAWEQLHQGMRAPQNLAFVVPEEDWNERNFARWFKASKPDVILGYDPEIIEWLKRLGQSVPADVGFAHLWTPDTTGNFAGIYHNPPAIGVASVDFLVGMIQRNERGIPTTSQTLLLESTWQDGATLRMHQPKRREPRAKRK
jgi:LacI family transcriptional regulator